MFDLLIRVCGLANVIAEPGEGNLSADGDNKVKIRDRRSILVVKIIHGGVETMGVNCEKLSPGVKAARRFFSPAAEGELRSASRGPKLGMRCLSFGPAAHLKRQEGRLSPPSTSPSCLPTGSAATMSSLPPVYIVSSARTPVGSFLG